MRRQPSPPPTNRRLPSTARSVRRTNWPRAFATFASAPRTRSIILDAKRNDIGNTAEAYAREAFDRYGADAVTVNPYMGEDSVRPFLARPESRRGPAVPHLQSGGQGFSGSADRRPAALSPGRGARADRWNGHRNLMLVVGATYPREMAELRRAHPDVTFLVPGIGAQGGDLEATLAAGLDARGAGLLISASRSMIYAGGGTSAAIRRRGGGLAHGNQPAARKPVNEP